MYYNVHVYIIIITSNPLQVESGLGSVFISRDHFTLSIPKLALHRVDCVRRVRYRRPYIIMVLYRYSIAVVILLYAFGGVD